MSVLAWIAVGLAVWLAGNLILLAWLLLVDLLEERAGLFNDTRPPEIPLSQGARIARLADDGKFTG